MAKSPDAFRTISEVADWLGIQAHVLRFWESKFTQVRPVKRAGGRRYYRPNDMQLLGGIKRLLHDDGLTIKGVQKILREKGVTYVGTLCLESLETAGKSKPDTSARPKSEETPIEALLTEDASDGAEEGIAANAPSLVNDGPVEGRLTGADTPVAAAFGDSDGATEPHDSDAAAQAAHSNSTPNPEPEAPRYFADRSAAQERANEGRESDQDDTQKLDAEAEKPKQEAEALRTTQSVPDAQPSHIGNGRDHSRDQAQDSGETAQKPAITRPIIRRTEDAFAKLPALDEDAQDARIIALYHRLKLLRDRLQGESRLDHR
jgi:DNA-binding transcriptional MerR regulator